MDSLRVGIVGCGKVAHIHAANLGDMKNLRFCSVWNRTRIRAEEFALQYGVTPYADVGEMVRRERLDIVIVCTAHPFHAEPSLQAIGEGANVLVEKPLAASLVDCDRMIGAAREKNVRLGTVSQRRWYAPVQRVKRAIDDGKIGSPILGTVQMLGWRDRAYYESDPWRGTWEAEGGGVLVNQAPHQLDLLHWFMGPVDELYGCWGNLNHPYIEVEDTAVAVVRFKSGALGSIVVSNSQDPALFGRVWVHGSNGATVGVQTDGGAMFIAGMSDIAEPPVNDRWTVPGEGELLRKWQEEDGELFRRTPATSYYHRLQVEDFVRAVIDEREPSVTGEEGRKTVELFTAIYRSHRDGKPVKFPLEPELLRADLDGRIVP